ncbi:hypothetical protein ABPG75_013857 [Micractinium tetrahymenae]
MGVCSCKIRVEVDPSYESPSGECPGNVNLTAVYGYSPPYGDATMFCLTEYLSVVHTPGTTNLSNPWYDALAYRGFSTAPGSPNFDVACWDWRLTPDTVAAGAAETDPWTGRAYQAIERLHDASGHKPVYLVGASNGALWIKALLDSMPQARREHYVAGFAGFAPAIGGLNQCFIATVLGLDLNMLNVAPPLAPAVSTLPIGYYCSPQPGLWKEQQPMATDTTAAEAFVQYYPANLSSLYMAANMSYAADLLHSFLAPETTWTQPPGVDTLLVYGFGVPTVGDVVSDTWVEGLPLRSFDVPDPLASFGVFSFGDGVVDTIAADVSRAAGWAAADPCHTLSTVNITDPTAAANPERALANASLPLSEGGSPAFHDNLWTSTAGSPSVAPVLDFIIRPPPARRPGC